MIKHTQTIRRQIADELFACFWPFRGLWHKGLENTIFKKEHFHKQHTAANSY